MGVASMIDPWLVHLAAVAPEWVARPPLIGYWERPVPVPYWEPVPMPYREPIPMPYPLPVPMPYREPVAYRPPPCPPAAAPCPGGWTIRPGDSFWGIAGAVGTSPETLQALNPWYHPCNLPIGGCLQLP